jgi:hypothetical protein
MPLEEYLYVDDERLDEYVEQIGSPNTSDKVPIWTAKLGVFGPAAEGTQQRLVRPLTRHEKIERLVEHLKKTNELGERRFVGRAAFAADAKQFRFETCRAVKTFIPALTPEAIVPKDATDDVELEYGFSKVSLTNKPDLSDAMFASRKRKARELALERAKVELGDFKGINVWVSDAPEMGAGGEKTEDQLFLIVGFTKNDQEGFRPWSAYSSFAGLVSDMGLEFSKTVMREVAQSPNEPNSQFHQDFLRDPLKCLREAGAKIGSKREIKTLYRVRETILYKHPDSDRETTATIGYPIYIAGV